jgi:hypothetical protein
MTIDASGAFVPDAGLRVVDPQGVVKADFDRMRRACLNLISPQYRKASTDE